MIFDTITGAFMGGIESFFGVIFAFILNNAYAFFMGGIGPFFGVIFAFILNNSSASHQEKKRKKESLNR